ncbi:MAG: DUF305 domain-containing protein [Candidatus Planktophila sp.]|nr:DUF305 domain-containing protein [Candidatus Planktophila sp.]
MFKKFVFVLISLALVFPATPVHATSHAKSLNNLGANDIMFAQLMIPHHQQAIDMSKTALKNGAGREVKILAKAIISAQKKEILQMKYWLTATKSANAMAHDMGMNGMLGASEMKTLKSLRGKDFDKFYLEAMIKHHLGALEMAGYLKATKNSEAKKLEKDIRAAQSGEIATMKKMLSKLG